MRLQGLSESTLVKIPHCWKSHVTANIIYDKKKANMFATYFVLIQCSRGGTSSSSDGVTNDLFIVSEKQRKLHVHF